MNYEKRKSAEVVVAHLDLLLQNLFRETEENHADHWALRPDS
jgi:hypothetical protein